MIDTSLTEQDFRYMSIPAILAIEKEKVQSAKRYAKQEHFIYFDDGTCAECHKESNILTQSSYLCKDCWLDKCFQIPDGKGDDKE
jgi:hypothetical protein